MRTNHTHSGKRKDPTYKKEENSGPGFELADVVFGDTEVGSNVLLRYAVEEFAGARAERFELLRCGKRAHVAKQVLVGQQQALGDNAANAAGLGMVHIQLVEVSSGNVNEYGRFQRLDAFAGRELLYETVCSVEEIALAGKPIGDVTEIALAVG